MAELRGNLHQDDLDEIRSRVRVDELIGEQVLLRRAGSGQLKGLCPFHDEKTPSFTVTPAKGFFYCFGCGKAGDVFDWVRETSSLSFPEAARWLADRAGIQLRDTGSGTEPAGPSRRRMVEALAATQTFYASQLETGEAAEARAELTSRGFTADDANRHGCGYAPRAGGLRAVLAGFSRDETAVGQGAGLRRDGGHDFFTGRLTWPLRDVTGRIVGFAARRLYDDDRITSKYVNSPAGPLFSKSELLYWLDVAKTAAAKTGRVFVVEGYTDVMAMDAAGIPEAVASCGTAFTDAHLRLLRRTVPDARIVFCFDGDTAGIGATHKAWTLAKDHLAHCWTVRLPEGQDPCDLRTAHGDQALREALNRPRPLTDVVLDDAITAALVDDTPETRALAVDAAVTVLKGIPDPVMRDGYLAVAARHLKVPLGHVAAKVGGDQPRTTPPAPAAGGGPRQASPVDRVVLTLAINHPEWEDQWRPWITGEYFAPGRGRDIANHVAGTATGPGWEQRLVDTSPEELRPLLIGILSHDNSPEDQQGLARALHRLRLDHLTAVVAQLNAQLAAAPADQSTADLSARMMEANAQLRDLKANRPT